MPLLKLMAQPVTELCVQDHLLYRGCHWRSVCFGGEWDYRF